MKYAYRVVRPDGTQSGLLDTFEQAMNVRASSGAEGVSIVAEELPDERFQALADALNALEYDYNMCLLEDEMGIAVSRAYPRVIYDYCLMTWIVKERP